MMNSIYVGAARKCGACPGTGNSSGTEGTSGWHSRRAPTLQKPFPSGLNGKDLELGVGGRPEKQTTVETGCSSRGRLILRRLLHTHVDPELKACGRIAIYSFASNVCQRSS